mgnify:CR=1 FL=1
MQIDDYFEEVIEKIIAVYQEAKEKAIQEYMKREKINGRKSFFKRLKAFFINNKEVD